MDELVSVIVPVFNAEEYLPQCLESIMAQTYKCIEIVLVDDGSQDGSYNICEKARQKDSRVQVIHSKNQGVSTARNIGLESSKGTLILFCDADDFMQDSMVAIMVEALQKHDSDMVICGRTNVKREFNKTIRLGYQGYWDAEQCIRHILSDDKTLGSVCNKLIRRELIDKVCFRPEIAYCEDAFFLVEVLSRQKTAKIFCIDDPLYYYRQLESSATNNISKLFDSQGVLKYNKTYLEMLKTFSLPSDIERVLYGKIWSVSVYTLYRYAGGMRDECRIHLLHYIKKYLFCYMFCSAFSGKEKLKHFYFLLIALAKLLDRRVCNGKD